MLILVVLVQTTLFAQSTQTIEKPLKLTNVAKGTKRDSLLVLNSSKLVKYVPVSDLLTNAVTQTALNGKENSIITGTILQYWRGDKTWQSLDKTALGLSNADNTSDLNKPISTATQTALGGKENNVTAGTIAQYYRGDKTWKTLDKTVLGLSSVDNTSDLNKPISTATQTALDLKQNNISTGTLSQYYRGDKTWAMFPSNVSAFINDRGYMTNADLTNYVNTYNPQIINGSKTFTEVIKISGSNKYLDLTNSNFVYGDYAGIIGCGTYNGNFAIASGDGACSFDTPDNNSNYTYKLPSSNGTIALTQDITKTAVGLANVDNTPDLLKPVSALTQVALIAKESTANKNVVNGYAGLGADGKVLPSLLPAKSYRSYKANFVQTGTADPVVTVLYNDLGFNIAWTRISVGTYLGQTASGNLVNGKKEITFTGATSGSPLERTSTVMNAWSINSAQVYVEVARYGSMIDGVVLESTLSINIYN